MTQPPNDCPIAQWLASVGYTGATRGAMATLYPEDVARLAKAVDAKVESACATSRRLYEDMIFQQQHSLMIQQRTIDAQGAHVARLKAEIASLRDGGKIKPLTPPTLGDIFEEAKANLGERFRDAFYIDPSGFLTPGVNGKQNP